MILRVMWTPLVLLCLISSFDLGAANEPLQPPSLIERSDTTKTRSRSVEDAPVRLPRKFRENSPTRRLHIENQTGFDGKVEKIHINSEEDLPGVQAYGLQKRNPTNNGYIKRMLQKEITEELDDASRIARSIEAYGRIKPHLATNGQIERIQLPNSREHHIPQQSAIRETRSIESSKEETEGELEDLEAQDAKIFRPLFVYRQQMSKKQHRGKNRIRYYQKPCYDRRPVF